MIASRTLIACLSAVVFSSAATSFAQEPVAPQAVSPAELQGAIDKLGDLTYETRTAASRTVRRTAATQAVPALRRAVTDHSDGYVRYRALVLLTGFNDPATKDVMLAALPSPNDRLRTVAYSYFEHHPDRTMVPALIAALDKERAEFVRPALVRALAALADDPRVQRILVSEVGRGEDFFRSVVIEALGDYKGKFAVDAIDKVSRLNGPLQDDAVIALGKIGEQRSLETLAALQRSAVRERQPSLAAAICLLGVNCQSHLKYLTDTLKFSSTNTGFQELLRSTAAGLAAVAQGGYGEAVGPLIEVGVPSNDPVRAPIALAMGAIALRNTPLFMSLIEKHTDRGPLLDLVAEGFDMLEEDLDKERFFAVARRTYWASPEGSPSRQLMQALITKLDF